MRFDIDAILKTRVYPAYFRFYTCFVAGISASQACSNQIQAKLLNRRAPDFPSGSFITPYYKYTQFKISDIIKKSVFRVI